MIITEQQGCYLNDRIDCELSPGELETLICEFKKLALATDCYLAQGRYRDLKDYFANRYAAWQQVRNKYSEDGI